MIRIVICDDMPEQLGKVEAACRLYFSEKQDCEVEILVFQNPMLLLEKLEKVGGCDIALLDICMPGISGMDIARAIRKRKDKTEIIFLTASEEYAVEAFAVNAAHYLLKPFSAADVAAALDRVLVKFDTRPVKKLYINCEGRAIQVVDAGQILYVESFRNRRCIYTPDGAFNETKRSLQTLLEELQMICPMQFVSPYRGYVVNFAAVSAITSAGIVLKSGTTIPIKPGGYSEIRDAFFQWSFEKVGY